MPTAAFNVPSEYRRFTLFAQLPPEIRLKVWEEYLKSPGASFIKVEPCDPTWRNRLLPPLLMVDDGEQDHQLLHLDEVSLAVKRESATSPAVPSRLVACYPVRPADISNYNTLHTDLATMNRTCRESSGVVSQLIAREGVLRLGNGALVALDESLDLVTLDYLPSDLHQTDCALQINFSCPDLDKVRRAAIRVSPMWKPARTFPAKCRTCHELHEVRDGGNCPTHLYQFLARHLPNLEEFYLMDYFVVEKSDSEKATWDILYGKDQGGSKCPATGTPAITSPACSCSLNRQTFRAKDRIFHEIIGDGSSDRAWKTDSKTSEIRDWLQDCFVRYCNKSSLARHKSPETVRFGILACQFNIPVPSPSKVRTYPSSGKLRPVRDRPTRAKACQGHKVYGRSPSAPFRLFRSDDGSVNFHEMPDRDIPTIWVGPAAKTRRLEQVAQAHIARHSVVDHEDQGRTWGGLLSFVFGKAGRNAFRFTFSWLGGSVKRWTNL
ncbi:hypothetical protein O9K51_07366 [Purpureocillium lavendulum]|uniref:2EXR domain-containing protein n=1 Tax=Purpureocillium lavendulum TaxID=1247861 RepID=A0AB34FM73_9HYPO|nr:hypothetical protein O9K51_07366 [Purpureocillium lavendulum]